MSWDGAQQNVFWFFFFVCLECEFSTASGRGRSGQDGTTSSSLEVIVTYFTQHNIVLTKQYIQITQFHFPCIFHNQKRPHTIPSPHLMHCQRSTNLSSSYLLHRPTTPFAKRNMQKTKLLHAAPSAVLKRAAQIPIVTQSRITIPPLPPLREKHCSISSLSFLCHVLHCRTLRKWQPSTFNGCHRALIDATFLHNAEQAFLCEGAQICDNQREIVNKKKLTCLGKRVWMIQGVEVL